MDAHTGLCQSLCVGRGKLFARQAKLTRNLCGLDALLAQLTRTRLRQLLRRKAELCALKSCLLLLCCQRLRVLRRKLVGLHTGLADQLLGRQAKLTLLLRGLRRELFGRQTKLPGLLRRVRQ